MRNLKFLYPFVLSSIFLVVNINCNKNNKTNDEADQKTDLKEQQFTRQDIEQIKYTEFVLSNLSDNTVSNWLKFQELNTQIEILKNGNISFFKDDKTILQSFIIDLKKEIPEVINNPSILVRLSVLETTIFKLEGISNINDVKKDILIKAIKEVLVAHSNLILQMNKKFEKDSQNIQKPN